MPRIFAIISFFAVFSVIAEAQVKVVGTTGKSSIAWERFQIGSHAAHSQFLTTLRSDLERSGYFAEGRAGFSEYLAMGSSTEGPQGMEVKLTLYRHSGGAPVMHKGYQGPMLQARRMAHQAADDILKALKGVDGIAAARVAVVGTRSGHKELFVVDSDGSNVRQLTQFNSTIVSPRWGPEGNLITFTAWLRNFPDVYMIDTRRGGQPQVVADFPGMNTGGVISPNGKEVALILSKDGKPELYVKPLRGGNPTRITYTAMSPKSSPSWSPDGKRIAFVSGQSGRPQVYVVDRKARANAERLTRANAENVSPHFGPDGRIVYAGLQGKDYHVAVLDPRTGQSTIISPPGASYEDPCWAPDGRHVVCTRVINYRSSVYILDTQGDAPIALLDGNGDWFSPHWSPR